MATIVIAAASAALMFAACSSDATERAAGSRPVPSAAPTEVDVGTGSAPTTPLATGPADSEPTVEHSGPTNDTVPSSPAPNESSSSSIPSSSSSSKNNSTTTTSIKASTTTTSTLPLVTSPGVVMVANASNVDGAAQRMTDELAFRGFTTAKAVSAAGIETDLETSKVYVLPGSEAVARSVARLLGGLRLAYMPTPISIKGGPANLNGATVVVMLGSDLAGKPLPT